jgi:hypothetical protein
MSFYKIQGEKIVSVNRGEKKPCYKKPEAVKQLEKLAFEDYKLKHSTMPEYAFVRSSFRDDTANSLTTCIVSYLRIQGAFASRVNNTGVYDPRLKKFRPGSSKKGLPDVLATYKGQSLFIEVKAGSDRMSEHQKKVEAEQQQAGGLYFIARNFTDFKIWFDNL